MTIRTITFDDEQWQLVPRELTGNMIDTINGHIDADSDAVALWRDTLIDAPEPPAQQPTRDLLAEATEQVEALDRENHRMRRCVARLMARLTVWLDDDQFNEADGIMTPEFEPPAQQPMVDFDIAIAAGDGTLHGAIDHWQERALAAEAKLAAQQPREPDDTQCLDHLIQTGAFRVFSPDINGNNTWIGVGRPIGEGATVREAIDELIKRQHGIGKGESND